MEYIMAVSILSVFIKCKKISCPGGETVDFIPPFHHFGVVSEFLWEKVKVVSEYLTLPVKGVCYILKIIRIYFQSLRENLFCKTSLGH